MSINNIGMTGAPGRMAFGRTKQLKEKGAGKQEVKNYFKLQGFDSRQEIRQTKQNGQSSMVGLFEPYGITPQQSGPKSGTPASQKGKGIGMMQQLKQSGISRQEIKDYLQYQGFNFREEVKEAKKSGQNPLAGLFEKLGIKPPQPDLTGPKCGTPVPSAPGGKGHGVMQQLKEKGVSKQEVKDYLKSQGYNSREEVMQAIKNGEKPLAGLLEQHGISPQQSRPKGGKPGGKGKDIGMMKQLKDKGISKQDIKDYLKSQGYNSREELMQAIKNGEKPLAGLFEQLGL